MEPVCIKIINIIDRLAHTSTTDQDALQTVYGLRRVAKGEMPSTLLGMEIELRSTPKSKQLTVLKRRVAALLEEKTDLENQIELLRARSSDSYHIPGTDYSYCEVMEIIREKLGKQNGGLTSWAEYSADLRATDPTVPLVTLMKLQTWRIAKLYPNWAVAQLLAMPVSCRSERKWSDDELDFLVNLHLANGQKTDDVLANECSVRFGCHINTNMIKGKLHMLRKLGRVPPRRQKSP